MIRAVLLGLLATTTLTACTKDRGGPVVTAGVTVGVVVERAGKVTATRAGATRELAVGGAVSGDDVIETAADGSVAIELAHNKARWSLGGGKTGKVSDSVAWQLPKAAGSAATVDHDMSAAGRHAEHSSADTAATTTKSAGESDAKKIEAEKIAELQKELSSAKDEAMRRQLQDQLQQTRKDKVDTTGGKQTRPDRKCDPADPLCDWEEPPKPTDPSVTAKATVAGDAAMRKCLGAAATSHIVVTCDGACKITSATNVDDAGRKCLDGRLGALGLANGKYTFVVDLAK